MVSACKADVLTGGSVPTGLNYRPTAKESSRLPVDYDLGQDYRALSMLGACPFIERIASFHSGHLWRGMEALFGLAGDHNPNAQPRNTVDSQRALYAAERV